MILRTCAVAAAAFAAAGTAAHAGKWDDEMAICLEAIATEAGEDAAGARADLKAVRDRATKRLTIEVDFASGREVTGVCEIARGKFSSVKIKES